MFSPFSRVLRGLSLVGLFALGLGGAAQTPAPPPAPPTEPTYVTHKDFRSKMFFLKHRDPRELARSLHSLGSGAKGAEVLANKDTGTLSVRDFPENIAAIEDALKRLDTPEPSRRDVEFHIHVLFASNSPVHGSDYPEELRDVLGALKSTLTYRSYTLAASLVQRAQDGKWVDGAGATEIQIAEAKGEKRILPMPFKFQIESVKVESPASGPAIIKLERFDFGFNSVPPEWRARIRSDLSLKDGEKVVVGTSTLKDRGVVIVVTARLLP